MTRNPFLTRNYPDAFNGRFSTNSSIDLSVSHPTQPTASVLWDAFSQRVNPLVRIIFSWSLSYWRSASTDQHLQKQLDDSEHALLFSLYLVSTTSLSEEECEEELHQPKATLMSKYQVLCEEALARTNILCITDITVLKALTIYMVSLPSTKPAFGLR